MSDLIAAVATPPGPGGVGIVRLSGPGAHRAAAQVFRPMQRGALTDAPDRQLVYGTVLGPEGEGIDSALAFVSRAPHSYTGEDTAELQCHGSPVVLGLVLEALYQAGARPARPGEFTQRAFLNGRLDLAQAEAVIDLIEADSALAVRNAAGQLAGALSRRIGGVYDALTDLVAHFCAVLDYPDEDIDPFRAEGMAAVLAEQGAALAALLQTAARGRRLRDGVVCALVGRPNAGKSSLLNALAGYERAIVTDRPGTTRDTVEAAVSLAGLPFRLVDTAGLRESDDPAERLGVARSRAAMDGADVVLLVCDGTVVPGEEERALLSDLGDRAVVVRSKADRPAAWDALPGGETVAVSARTGAGLDALEAVLGRRGAALLPAARAGAQGLMLTNARQTDAVRRALEAVRRAEEGLGAGLPPDLLLTDVEDALAALGELTGRTVREDVTDRIFSRFCVGK